MAAKFYHCDVCGNVMAAVIPSGVVPFCCDTQMTELTNQHVDGTAEHHVPEVKFLEHNRLMIKVGKDLHPSTSAHHICFIVVETDCGACIRYLDEDELPEVVIQCDGKPRNVYAYCNLHGLWRRCVKEDEKCCKP